MFSDNYKSVLVDLRRVLPTMLSFNNQVTLLCVTFVVNKQTRAYSQDHVLVNLVTARCMNLLNHTVFVDTNIVP